MENNPITSEEFIISEQDIKDVQNDIDYIIESGLSNTRGKTRFLISESFKLMGDPKSPFKTIAEFRKSLVGRDIRI